MLAGAGGVLVTAWRDGSGAARGEDQPLYRRAPMHAACEVAAHPHVARKGRVAAVGRRVGRRGRGRAARRAARRRLLLRRRLLGAMAAVVVAVRRGGAGMRLRPAREGVELECEVLATKRQ